MLDEQGPGPGPGPQHTDSRWGCRSPVPRRTEVMRCQPSTVDVVTSPREAWRNRRGGWHLNELWRWSQWREVLCHQEGPEGTGMKVEVSLVGHRRGQRKTAPCEMDTESWVCRGSCVRKCLQLSSSALEPLQSLRLPSQIGGPHVLWWPCRWVRKATHVGALQMWRRLWPWAVMSSQGDFDRGGVMRTGTRRLRLWQIPVWLWDPRDSASSYGRANSWLTPNVFFVLFLWPGRFGDRESRYHTVWLVLQCRLPLTYSLLNSRQCAPFCSRQEWSEPEPFFRACQVWWDQARGEHSSATVAFLI
jgi:hypothetical protein